MTTQPIHRPGRPHPALSRRALLAGTAAGAVGLSLAACGKGKKADSKTVTVVTHDSFHVSDNLMKAFWRSSETWKESWVTTVTVLESAWEPLFLLLPQAARLRPTAPAAVPASRARRLRAGWGLPGRWVDWMLMRASWMVLRRARRPPAARRGDGLDFLRRY